MLGYSFPGNIRELKSIVELTVTLSGANEITTADIVIDSGNELSDLDSAELTLKEYELKIIRATLLKYNNNIRVAAKKLGIGISTIYRLLKEVE